MTQDALMTSMTIDNPKTVNKMMSQRFFLNFDRMPIFSSFGLFFELEFFERETGFLRLRISLSLYPMISVPYLLLCTTMLPAPIDWTALSS